MLVLQNATLTFISPQISLSLSHSPAKKRSASFYQATSIIDIQYPSLKSVAPYLAIRVLDSSLYQHKLPPDLVEISPAVTVALLDDKGDPL